MPGHREARAGLKKFAQDVLRDAETFLAAWDKDPRLRAAPPRGSLDPEDWALMRHYARKILDALDADVHVDPDWIEAICKCAERRERPTDGD